MRYEPSLDRSGISDVLRDAYGVRAERLHFLPFGYATACYRVERAHSAPLFLKIWPRALAGGQNPSWRPESLGLVRAINERRLPIAVPAPLPTLGGTLWTEAAGMPLALFPFVDGHRSLWTPALRATLARTIAAIHRATPALADLPFARERFALPWLADLRRGLDRLAVSGPHDRAGLRALRDLVLPRRAEIAAHLARLERLRAAVRELPGPWVLCHTDIGDDNLLVDQDGRLIVLDWDEACLAPPEYDLYDLCAQHGPALLRCYRAAEGYGPLYRDHFAFALLRRALGDMAVRFLDILAGGLSTAAEQEALRGIETWGFARWRSLDATLAMLAPLLR